MSRNILAFTSFIILASTFWLRADTSFVYQSDDWCLKHSGENLEFFPVPNRPRGVPEFRAQSEFPLSTKSASEGETGLIISFTGNPSYSTISPETHRGRKGCIRVVQENGLSQLTGEGLTNCSVRESRDWHDDWFEPTETFSTLQGVFIRCGRNVAIRNCQMTGLLPNGWEAQITLPIAYLDAWQSAARTAHLYFDTYLTDCGGN